MSPHPLSKMLDFLGYGNPKAPLWFVGGEEGFGGKMTEQERVASLYERTKWSSTMDMHEAHLNFREAGKPIDISKPRAGSILVWRWMARIALSLEGQSYEQACLSDREFVYHHLGRARDATFLTETSAVPCVKANRPHPLVKDLVGHAGDARLRSLFKHWLETQPLTICYGLGRRDSYSSMLKIKWENLPGFDGKWFFTPSKRAFLLPFFGQGKMSHKSMQEFLKSPQLLAAWAEARSYV